ncbi:hypothetical protein AOLI_G00022410 [Acnodon oligacanthus]
MRLTVNTELSLCVGPGLALPGPSPARWRLHAQAWSSQGPPHACPPRATAEAGHSQQERHSSLVLVGRARVKCEFTVEQARVPRQSAELLSKLAGVFHSPGLLCSESLRPQCARGPFPQHIDGMRGIVPGSDAVHVSTACLSWHFSWKDLVAAPPAAAGAESTLLTAVLTGQKLRTDPEYDCN